MHDQIRITGSTHIAIPDNLIFLSQEEACKTSFVGPLEKSSFSDAPIHMFPPPN